MTTLPTCGLRLQTFPRTLARIASPPLAATKRAWRPAPGISQGNVPQCAIFSQGAHLGSSPNAKRSPVERYPELYKSAQDVDEIPGNNYDGTTLLGAFKAFQLAGFYGRNAKPVVGTTIEQLVFCLREIGPVCWGSEWTMGLEMPRKDGEIRPTGVNLGGHGVLVHAIEMDSKGKGRIYLTNWRGLNWGMGGRAWMSLQNAQRLLNAGGQFLAVPKTTEP
jgi:hypothetical protein